MHVQFEWQRSRFVSDVGELRHERAQEEQVPAHSNSTNLMTWWKPGHVRAHPSWPMR